MSTFGFLNPFVQSRWKERAAAHDAMMRAQRKRAASGIEAEGQDTEEWLDAQHESPTVEDGDAPEQPR